MIKSLSIENLKEFDLFPPAVILSPAVHHLSFTYAALFVSGNYHKFSRTVSNSDWIIKGQKKTDTSVEEVILSGFSDFAKLQDIKFTSAGREDSDVRMLGKGRPFLVQLNNSNKVTFEPSLLTLIESKINSSPLVNVSNLQSLAKKSTSIIKEGEEKKKEILSMCCLVITENFSSRITTY